MNYSQTQFLQIFALLMALTIALSGSQVEATRVQYGANFCPRTCACTGFRLMTTCMGLCSLCLPGTAPNERIALSPFTMAGLVRGKRQIFFPKPLRFGKK